MAEMGNLLLRRKEITLSWVLRVGGAGQRPRLGDGQEFLGPGGFPGLLEGPELILEGAAEQREIFLFFYFVSLQRALTLQADATTMPTNRRRQDSAYYRVKKKKSPAIRLSLICTRVRPLEVYGSLFET